MATYWVENNGTGTGLLQSSPTTFSGVWPLVTAGDTVMALDGTYKGLANMCRPPEGLNGTSTNPITVKALNDGMVLIDGEYARAPVRLTNNRWWVLEGFNCRHGGGENATLLLADNNSQGCFGGGVTTGSNDIVVRRVIAWDSNGQQNTNVILVCGSSRTTFEDCAAFGMGRQTIGVYGTCNSTTFRRVWGRFEGSVASSGAGPLKTFQPHYGSSGVINTVCENCVGTWWAGSMPQTYTSWNPFAGTAGSPHTNYELEATPTGPMFSEGNAGEDTQTKCYGSFFYLRAGDSISSGSNPTQMFSFRRSNNQVVQDTAVFVPSAFTGSGSIIGWDLGTWGGSTGNVANRITSVKLGSDGIDAAWSVSNYSTGSSLNTVTPAWNPWTSTNGANLCYRYINGERQDGQGGRPLVPLWPWPMNQRIKDALVQAGTYTGPCGSVFGFNETNGGADCSGGRFTRSGTADVTADIEVLLGSIPAACRTGTLPILTVAPTALVYTMTQGDSPSSQTVTITNTGSVQPMAWSVTDNQTWLSASPSSASDVGSFTATVDITGLTVGVYSATLTVAASPASNSPQLIPVSLTVNAAVDVPNPDLSTHGRGVHKIKRKFWGTWGGGH